MASASERVATLSSYVPQVVLRHVLEAARGGPVGGSARFPAALMLIDIAGFTPLTEAAVRRGPAAVESLSRSINDYLGQIIDLIDAHGGDITKIVGDALIPLWPAYDGDLAGAARQAAACGLAIAADLGEMQVDGELRLSVKVGLCAGEVSTGHVGGLEGEWLFVLAGPGVAQLGELERHVQAGDVIASPSAWSVVSDRFVGQPLADGHVRLRPGEQSDEPRSEQPLELPAECEAELRAHVPRVLQLRLDAGQADWLAELRPTTVLFANVRGIDQATTEADRIVQKVAEGAQQVLRRYDGWLKELTLDDKGTSLIAVFGVAPYSHEDDATRAVEAALAIAAHVSGLGLAAGIGVASGPTFCGPVGNARRRDFALLGGHLNLAARLMQAADDGAVLCDAATHEATRGRQAFERLPAYVLKGLSRPIDVFRARPAESTGRSGTMLVDRTREMATAQDALVAAAAGQGGMLLFEGEPGIGKSRIVEELLGRAARLGIRAAVGSATDIELTTPYNAWRAVFEELLGVAAVSDGDARRTVVLDRLAASPESLRLVPLLGPVLSLDLPDNDETRQFSGSVRADNTHDLLVRILRDEMARKPLVVVLEDGHWLDSASWALLGQVRRELPELLVVLTTRPVADVPALASSGLRNGSTTLRLTPLARADVIALAAQRTGATQLADPVAAMVHERSEGNPLFIEQLTYAMRDAGLVVVERGMLRPVAGSGALAPLLPDTVQRVITTRLDQLSPAQSMAIKVASVIGQRFAVGTLADLHPLSIGRDELDADLERLVRLDLLAPAAAPQPSYEFRHKITQEVAYNMMPRDQSRRLHAGLAEWYERNYADLSPFHSFLAYHWRQAGHAEKAIRHLELAGGQALRTFANEEAIGFLREAITLASESGVKVEPARRARWHLTLGEAHVNLSQYREGREQLELGLKLLDHAVPGGSLRRSVAVIGQLGGQAFRRFGRAGAGRRLEPAEREQLVAVCRAYERLAEASYYGGETLLPLYAAIRILNDAEASGSAPEIARGLAGTGALFGLVPMARVAEGYLRRALERLAEVDDLTTHEIVGIVVGYYQVGAGQWEPAREQFVNVRGIARRLGDRRRLMDALSNLAEIEYLRGNFRASADVARELLAVARGRNDRRFEAEALIVVAHCAGQLRETDEAERSSVSLKAIMGEVPDVTDELRLKSYGVAAQLHMFGGERTQALGAADEALRLAARLRPTYFATFLGYVGPAEVYLDLWQAGERVGEARPRAGEALQALGRYARVFPIGRPRHALLLGRQAWLAGRRAAAIQSWRHGLELAGELDMPFEQATAHLELGLHLPVGDPERDAHLATARTLLGGLEAAAALARLAAE